MSALSIESAGYPKGGLFTWSVAGTDTDLVDHYRLEVNPDGASGFVPVDGASALALPRFETTLPLHLIDWPNAMYRVEALDSSGTVIAATETSLRQQLAPRDLAGGFKPNSRNSIDEFGSAVDLSSDGSTMAIGVPESAGGWIGIDHSSTPENELTRVTDTRVADGAVYVFVRGSDGSWREQAYIRSPEADTADEFGHSIALSANGNHLVVGAPGGQRSTSTAGAAFLYERIGGTWQEAWDVQPTMSDNSNKGDRFGASVDVSADGERFVVGAPGDDSDVTGVYGDVSTRNVSANGSTETSSTGYNAGAVHVYAWGASATGSGWGLEAYIKASNADEVVVIGSDRKNWSAFGRDVALSSSGDRLVAGAPLESSDGVGVDSSQRFDAADGEIRHGAAYVFDRTDTVWAQRAYLKASNTEHDDWFGTSVAISGDGSRVGVGAPREDSSGTGVNAVQDDDYVPPYNNTNSGIGAMYVFDDATSGWHQRAYVKPIRVLSAYQNYPQGYGTDISISHDGTTIAVGAPYESTNNFDGDYYVLRPEVGAAYVLQEDSGQLAYTRGIKQVQHDGAHFGYRVSLSADGRSLAVGTPYDKGEGLNESGEFQQVAPEYIFPWYSTTTTPIGATYLF